MSELLRSVSLSLACGVLLACIPGCRNALPDMAKSAAFASPTSAATGIRRTLLGRAPSHEPGWETRLYLIEYPPQTSAPLHVHPSVGVGWVIDGELDSAFGDEPVVRVHAGQGFIDSADRPHRLFRNPSLEHELRFVIAYTIRTIDEPFRLLP